MNMTRQEMLEHLSTRLVTLPHTHPLRVALDGIDAAGKTTLANELAPLIQAQGRPVIRASIDGFHQPRHIRYQRGPESPEGYYEDSFDYPFLRTLLLEPLGPQGNRRYQRALFDFRADTPLAILPEEASANAVLLFDGVFLLRPELIDQWDYRIFVSVKMELALQRALQRDLPLFGSAETIRMRYLQRYLPGQRLYYQVARPYEQADVIVDNNDPSHPQLVFPSQMSCFSAFEQ
jgi:uridine kinase